LKNTRVFFKKPADLLYFSGSGQKISGIFSRSWPFFEKWPGFFRIFRKIRKKISGRHKKKIGDLVIFYFFIFFLGKKIKKIIFIFFQEKK